MMKNGVLLAALLVCGGIAGAQPGGNTLKPVSEFDRIGDRQERAIALFTEAGKVLNSPHCLNCHPGTDRPTQSDAIPGTQKEFGALIRAWAEAGAFCPRS